MMSFPDDITSNKDEKWHLDYTKAAWDEFNASGINGLYLGTTVSSASGGMGIYDTIASYMEGSQRIDQYKPLMGVDVNATDTWMNLDWSVLPVMPKQWRVCSGILNKTRYKVGFQPLDQLATDAKNKFFAEMKARIEMRDQIKKQAGENAEEVIKAMGLDKGSDEPGDMEELEMMAMYTYKHIASIEMEEDVTAVLSMNKIDAMRKEVRKNLFYYGVAGFKDYIDNNGTLKVRSIDPRMLIAAPCEKNDFSDARYRGEVMQVSITELAQMNQGLTDQQLIRIATLFVGKYGNLNVYPSSRAMCGNYKVPVVDLEWDSIEHQNWEVGMTKYGDKAVVRAPMGKNGSEFVRNRIKVIRRAKWIPGTEHIWDWGLATNMKRAKDQLSEVVPNYHIIAPMKSGNKIQSIGQMVQPLLDQIQMSWLKYQKAKSEAKSQGLHIEMGALEDVGYGKGGNKMKPSELVDFFEQKNILLWRRKGRFGDNDHGKPIEVVPGSGLDDVLNWFQSLQNEVQQLKDLIGLNDFTDASTPDARALSATVNTAQQSTNNSLFDIIDTDVELMKRLSASVVLRLQDMAELGLLDRYAMAIGDNSVDFMKKMEHVAHHDFAIEVRELPSDEERLRFVEDAKALAGNDLITFEDLVLIRNTDDMREAERILAWRLRRRKQEKIQESLMLQQQNAEVQSQSGIAVEKEKQNTAAMEGEIKKYVADKQAEAMVMVAQINAGASTSNKALEVSSKQQEMAEAA